ncbi:dephospho-CoA kinase [Profundibacterium mesophilum]|uniref:Dephospho-CoA kinase n=1 Tax=Profundibacterium mesophilum KAUST100406-0324 TaxID=1037889 RepID=A0A921NX15_9RHOB|nr:dephospho-CoA kinase [Profundibacterium mesophilum]KAF0676314.1 Dephospho-CoA kinase [Profundibacterium mesophilum KAUST100406-0324]
MNAPFVIAITGSIGMGKSTTCALFEAEGVPVWDADAAVHRLYGPGGAATARIGALCPAALGEAGIDRAVLAEWIADDPGALPRIEAIVHPLVAQDRADFIARTDAPIVVLDIPLLFETGGAAMADHVVVVSTDARTQRARVMARPGMTDAKFETILARQLPDARKRAQADTVIETDSPDTARRAVQALLAQIRRKLADA